MRAQYTVDKADNYADALALAVCDTYRVWQVVNEVSEPKDVMALKDVARVLCAIDSLVKQAQTK